MKILGISAYYHDSAAALVEDGRIVAAAQEERFSRIKGDSSFPAYAVDFCLRQAGIDETELDQVVYYEDPVTKFERLLTSYQATAPRSLASFLRAMPQWLIRKLWLRSTIAGELGVTQSKVSCCDHHLSHAASAFFPSPFEEAAVLTVDGVGEWSTASWGIGKGSSLLLREHLRFPNSWGLLYSAFTAYCGFKINSGEYKLMGLAPYGRPRFTDVIKKHLVHMGDDGSLALNQTYFNYLLGLTMTNREFERLFGGPPREQESQITQREMDLAASIQAIFDEAMMKMAKYVHHKTGLENVVLAGGVALNVVSVGHLSSHGPFKQVWTQPAAGDAGGSVGAALWYWHSVLGEPRTVSPLDAMSGALLGPDIAPGAPEDEAMLKRLGAVWTRHADRELQDRLASLLSDGKVVAIARGRMEFGPRALGARSILGDPRNRAMQTRMNLKIKFRESFRPFAPIVLEDHAGEYFDVKQKSPYMLLVYPVRETQRLVVDGSRNDATGLQLLNVVRSSIPAVTHVDFSARVQTVDNERSPFLHELLETFHAKTGCPVLINTSFNVRGEPIVNTAEDAFRCFMATEIDALVVGDRLLLREEQQNLAFSEEERAAWLQRFDLD